MNTCKTCKHWMQNDPEYGEGGTCCLATDNSTDKKMPVFAVGSEFLVFAGGRFGYLHCGPDFGCVHHSDGQPAGEEAKP